MQKLNVALMCIAVLLAVKTVQPALGGEEMPIYHKKHPYMEWWRESMETRDERLEWWRDARFGMFVHWGVYSRLGGVWQGEPVSGYAEHIMRKCEIPVSVYREEVAGKFNQAEFDAEEWVKLIH